jgi:hypothetical protein
MAPDSNSSSDSNSNPSKGLPLSKILLGTILACSLLFNILLVRKIERLENNISFIKAEGQLVVGEQVQSFAAKDPWGQIAVLDYYHSTLPTVLYVFTPGCESCARNLSNIKALVSQTTARYRIVGISLIRNSSGVYCAKFHHISSIYRNTLSDCTDLQIRWDSANNNGFSGWESNENLVGNL